MKVTPPSPSLAIHTRTHTHKSAHTPTSAPSQRVRFNRTRGNICIRRPAALSAGGNIQSEDELRPEKPVNPGSEINSLSRCAGGELLLSDQSGKKKRREMLRDVFDVISQLYDSYQSVWGWGWGGRLCEMA